MNDMKVKYDKIVDILYITLNEKKIAESNESKEGINRPLS